jgi:hypothetical protein
MPSYNNKKYKESNINYLNKDFASYKNTLIEYAKSYFPDTYRDFNESSPGMMLIEMSAYVGDVLSFYIDQQYREMLLPLAEERRNVKNMAKMLGYRVKPTIPAFVDLTFKQKVDIVNVGLSTSDPTSVNYDAAGTFDKGVQCVATGDSTLIFETLDVIDFSITQAGDTDNIATTDDNGVANSYELSRTVRAVSGETKTTSFTVTVARKFLELTLSETNVIDIISIYDSNGNRWYEVEYLAQDKVPYDIHYTGDSSRQGVYYDIGDSSTIETVPVPYSLEYITTSKRFITKVNDNDKTSIVFGNGILKNGSSIEDGFLDLEQAGITIPGQTTDLESSINPMLGNDYASLGEVPNQVTLTVKYRVGGGIKTNIAAEEIVSISGTPNKLKGPSSGNGSSLESVINQQPSAGGRGVDTIEEIREKATAHFTTQNRAVTKEDYEARVLNMSSKYGALAKVYAVRSDIEYAGAATTFDTNVEGVQTEMDNFRASMQPGGALYQLAFETESQAVEFLVEIVNNLVPLQSAVDTIPGQVTVEPRLGTIDLYILSYDKNKNLTGNFYADELTNSGTTTYGVPNLLKTNIKNYLENYKILTDFVTIQDGFIVNFGVAFDVVANATSNKAEVKLQCIQVIKEFFTTQKMNFGRPLYIGELEYELMGVDGVRSVNYVCATQDNIYVDNNQAAFSPSLYTYSISAESELEVSGDDTEGQSGYGWKYDFSAAFSNGVISPINPANPGCFEIKNPNQNIIGIVR